MITREMKVVDAYPLIGKQFEDIFILLDSIQTHISAVGVYERDIKDLNVAIIKIQNLLKERDNSIGARKTFDKVATKARANARKIFNGDWDTYWKRWTAICGE